MSPPIRSWLPGAARRLPGLWWKPIPEDLVRRVREGPIERLCAGRPGNFTPRREPGERKIRRTVCFLIDHRRNFPPEAWAIVQNSLDRSPFSKDCFAPFPARIAGPRIVQFDEVLDYY